MSVFIRNDQRTRPLPAGGAPCSQRACTFPPPARPSLARGRALDARAGSGGNGRARGAPPFPLHSPPIPKSSLRGSAFAAPPPPSPLPPSLPTKCDTGRLQVPRIKVSLQSKLCSNIKKRFFIVHAGEKSGNDQEEARLQNASKQIVCTAIQQAVRQLSQESQTEEKATSSSVSLQLERRQSTKKHEKK
ncbi:uncharacterized protein LOC110079430 isoform X2 [Pogona vitticeps]